jgi:hypothetical protein
MIDIYAAVERRRRLYRAVFLGITVLTLPFYCIGFALLGSSGGAGSRTPTATMTPIGANRTLTATNTRSPLVTSTLLPTNPGQPAPTTFFPTQPIVTIPIFPTSTTAPTLTVAPSATFTFTSPPSTNTQPPILPPTDTPQAATQTSVGPTNTFEPLPTEAEAATSEFPTLVPIP